MRWFVTGDCHGDLTKIYNFINRFDLDNNCAIIICGDTGIYWKKDKTDAEQIITQYESKCNGVHLYWIDGNHENFDIINQWTVNLDGLVHNSEHIHYIPRSTALYLNVNGIDKSALFIGGADSVDKFRRIKHLSWWEEETISNENVENVDSGHYDYVFSHCCPFSEVQEAKGWLFTLSNITENNAIHMSEKQLDRVKNKIEFNNWFFGHYHVDRQISDKFRCLFNDFIELQ